MAQQPQQGKGFFGDDFGQKIDLTARIREILRNYPEGTSIFKELLQNADDAGARELRLVLDERSHPTAALASPALASLQGPALLCYNDAQFSEVDFQSIQRIGDSLKKEESQGAKTGRFGVGFNSVYHVTELPTFVSGRHVAMFDPQAKYIPNVNPANPGKKIDFLDKAYRQVLQTYADQFKPLRAFGCDVLAPTPTAFPATLFRFPLRTPAQAEASRLSKQAHPIPAVRAQLEAFAKEAAGLLLFLKNVERLSVWLWPSGGGGGGGDDGPVKVAEASISNVTEELRRQRNFVARTMAASGGGKGDAGPPPAFAQQPVGCDYTLETVTRVLPPFAPAGEGEQGRTETWIVCNRLGGGRAGAIASAREYQHMKLIPWAGVAGRVASSSLSSAGGKEEVDGLAYCFLPLPVPTQLPVHVNGFFELSSNRRDIWQGDDMVGDGALRAAWNRSLLCEIVVPCYTRLLQLAAQRCGPGPVYDALWPVRAGGPAWAGLLDAFFAAAAPLPLLHTALPAAASSRAGRWAVGGSTTEGQWVAPRDAVVIPPEARQLQQQQQAQREEGEREGVAAWSLDRVLLLEGLPVLKTTRPQLEEALVARKVAPRVATPEFVRAHFRVAGPEPADPKQKQQQHPALKEQAAVLLLLYYCVSDLSDHAFAALDGLPLLPAADAGAPPRAIVLYALPEGSPAVRQLTGMGFPLGLALQALRRHPPARVGGGGGVDAALAWILERQAGAERAGEAFELGELALGALEPAEELALFGRLAPRLVDFPRLPDKARAILQAPRFQRASNVRCLNPALLPTVLRYAVPAAWRDAARVPWAETITSGSSSRKDGGGDRVPDLAWFCRLWQYLLGKMNDDLRPLAEGVPFLPCNEGCVVRLSAKLPVLLLPAASVPSSSPSPPLAPALVTALRGLGVLTVHDALVAEIGAARLGAALRASVLPARRSGVLAALRLLGRDPRYGGGGEGGGPQEALEALSRALAAAWGPEAKDALRALLLAEPLAELTQEELALVKALPVFRGYGDSGGSYVSLLGPTPLFLLEGIPAATLQPLEGLLSAQFLRAEDPLEPALLKRLGAQQLPKATFLLEHVFPAFSTHPPALRARAMLELVLADLGALAQADARMLPALRELPFLPTAGGGAGEPPPPQQQQRLARCADLYDPEVEELTSLVGAELFPHPDFAAPETLALLRQLGLRSTLRFGDVIRIARSTQAVYEEAATVAAAAAATSSGKGRGGKRGEDAVERAEGALGRARMLFKFVNENAERFFTPVRESTEVAALRRKSAGGIFSRALSLFDEQARAAERHRQLQLEEEERQRQHMVEELKAIRWVPVLVAPPLPYLPWRQPQGRAGEEGPGLGLVAPARARLYEDMWYASSRFGILAQDTHAAELVKAAYGWRAPLSLAVVAEQLVAIAAAFHEFSASATAAASEQQQQLGASAGNPSSPSPPPAVQAMQQQVASVVPVAYQVLSSSAAAGAPRNASAGEAQAAVRPALAGAPWVFVGDRFVQAEQVAFAAQVNATPYLYSVPADLACFAPLLKAHGVRPAFGAGDFVQVLQTMAVETGAAAAGGKDGATPLTPEQLELAIALVQRISDESMMVGNWEVFVPDENGRLARSSALVYDDAPWLSKMQNRADIRFAHPKISSGTGEKLGIRSVRRLLMETHADAMDFDLPTTEAFGQSEALTRRLRHILELYPEGPSILGELIQNADDAGASTVRILYSARQYGTTALLGSKMAAWQGPALYFYNDAQFSQQDFQNIARIGQASKLDKVLSTGRFGLGFNATYHCTDLPSFVSAEHLVIFDPHVRHLPGATRQQPGIKIRFVDMDLLGTFPDQFEPYTLFGCTLRDCFPGTLFRFPVRTPELARESEISKACYDAGTVKELFASFQVEATISRYLLFLRHVDHIEVYVAHDPATDGPTTTINGGGSPQPQLLYRASRRMDDRRAWDQASAFMAGPPRAPLSKEAFYAKLGSTPVAHLPRVKELVTVSYAEGRVGFEGRPLHDGVVRRRRVDEFMVCAGLGGGAALAMAVDPKHKHLKFIPFGGVAAHIYTQDGTLMAAPAAITAGSKEEDEDDDDDDPLLRVALGPKRLVDPATAAKRGQAFCFLPLPVDSGLPVLINGYFELSSNRRDIWQGSDMSGEGALRSAWNQALLQDVVAPLYAQLVQEMAGLLTPPPPPPTATEAGAAAPRPPLRWYYSLFPVPEATQQHFAVVGTRFYELAAPRAVLWSELRGGSWAPAQTAMLVDLTEEEEEEVAAGRGGEAMTSALTVTSAAATARADAARLRAVLLLRGCCIVPVPAPLKRVLVAEQCCHHEVSPPLVRQLVREAKGVAYQQRQQRGRASSGLEPWPATQEDAQLLLVYCASDLVEKGDVSELDGLPLLPLADGSLGTLAIVGLQQGLPTYFTVGEAERPLFARGQHVLVLERERLLPKVAALLENDALMRPTNVAPFAPPHLDAFLQAVLPLPFAEALEVAWRPGEVVGGRVIPDAEWVRRFWAYLASARGVSTSTTKPQTSSSSPLRLLGRGAGGAASIPPSTASESGGSGSARTLLGVTRVCGRWPLLPVLRGREKAPTLVRLDASLPLLHMSRASLPALSTVPGGAQALEERLEAALAGLGVRVVHRDALPESAEPLLTAPDSRALVPGLSTLGLLATLRKLCPEGDLGRVAPLFAEVGPSGRRALRALLGSARHMDAARREGARDAAQLEALVQALRCLPIYESYEGSALPEAEQRRRAAANTSTASSSNGSPGRAAPAIVAFCALAAWPDHWLPPDGVDPRLLDTGGPTFLRSAGAEDAQLLEFVGVRPIPLPAFYRTHVLAALDRLPPDVRLAAVGKLLADLPRLKQADAAFVEALREAAFVPDGAGQLKRPGELHDPLQGGLTGLLGPEAFPAPELGTPEAVTRLRTLGLRATLSLAGVLASAASVAALAGAGNREGAVRRGKELLRFLDHHLEELVEEEQEEEGAGAEAADGDAGGGAERGRRLPVAFVQGLRRPAWVPVRQAPPHPSLPWPATAMPAVLPPTGTRPQADMWLCSLRRGIAELDVSSPCLREALGWEDALDAATLAHQLVGLATGFQVGRGGSYRQILSKTVPEIYEELQEQLVDPFATERGAASLREAHAGVPVILAGASWVWVGDEFLPTTRVAFLAPPNSRPYLVQVPPELEKYAPLLRALGVRESFTVPDLARALQALHEKSSGPLPSLDLQQAIRLLRALQKTPFEERQEALRADVAIYAPAEDGTMHRIDTLCYNDAPWLLATVEGRVSLTFVHKDLPNHVARALGARSLREALLANQCAMAAIPCARARDIHAMLTPLASSALAATTTITGETPEANDAAGELALRAVLDVLELADEVGCRRVEVLADARMHGAESLLHPLLASAQGPALLIHLHDVVLSLDDLIRLASPTRFKHGPLTRPYPPRAPGAPSQSQQQQSGRRSSSGLGRSRTGSEDDKGQREAAHAWPVSGLGLSSLFHLTDLVQVLSGDTFVLFDPSAQFLVSEATVNLEAEGGGAAPSSAAEAGNAVVAPSPAPLAAPAAAVTAAGGEPQPVARRYTMSMGQRLHERFPHQFAPFASLGAAWTDAATAGANFAFHGTVIRCPLRRQAGALSPVVAPSVEALPLARLLDSVPPSLLFSLSLEEVGVNTWAAGAGEAEALARARLVETTPTGMRRFRRELMENREWRKNKLLAQLFKGNAPAPLSIHVAEVACTRRGERPYSEQWLLLDALAHGASRDAAMSEPLKTTLGGHSLLPLVSAAARLEAKNAQGAAATSELGPTGRAFSVIDTGSALGLRCHVNAPFFLCDALVPALREHLARGRARRDFHFAGLGAATGAHLIASGGRLRGEGADDLDRLARWNKALLSTLHEEVLPALLSTLRDLVVQAQGDGRKLYAHWPRVEDAPGRFKPLMRASGLGDRLANGQYFWARRPRELPAFVKLGEAYFFDRRKWDDGDEGGGRLDAFLRRLFPLFDVPCEVLEELRARNAPVKEVTPALLRRHLRAQAQAQASVAAVAGPMANALAREVGGTPGLGLDLLRFCLGDCGPEQAQADGLGACRARWRELAGLPLLPLEDGSVSAIAAGGGGRGGSQQGVILADAEQRALLPHLKHRFVAAPTAHFLLEGLKLAALPDALAALGMVRFGPDTLAAHVHTVLPPTWKGLVRVPVADWAQLPAPLSPLWLYRFWRQVPLGLAEELFAAWPLVPVAGGTELVNCALASHVLRLLPDDLDARLQAQLEAEQAREAAAAAAALGEQGSSNTGEGASSGRHSVNAQSGRGSSVARASSTAGGLSPRDICLDVKEVDLLYQQIEAAIAPSAAPATPSPRSDDEEDAESLPVVVAGTVADDDDDELLLPVAAEVVHHRADGESVMGAVVAAATVALAAAVGADNDDDQEDTEVGNATAAAAVTTTGPIPIVSDGAARLAAALTAPERERRQELLKALKKACVPVLELAFFPRETHALLTVTEPREVTHAVIAGLYAFKESVQLGGALTGDELDQLLRRLTTSSTGGGAGQLPVALTASEMEKLKQLPFFETLGGERVPIAEGGPYLVLDDREAGRDRFLDELLSLLEASAPGAGGPAVAVPFPSSSSMSRSKVLKRKPALDDLYKDLGVAALKKSEILSRFLVPSLPTLDRALRLRVLELLQRRWASERLAADAALVAALKETPFLERPNGELASPSELLDPRSDVLREVFEEDPGVFPQGEFASPRWLAILGALGLQGRANGKVMVEAAKRLEAFASLSLLPFAVACKAAKLVRHFVGDGELSVDKALLKTLAPIRFVPVERPGLHMTGPGPDTGAAATAAAESSSGAGRRGASSTAASSSSAAAAMTPNRQYQLVAFAEAAPAKDRHLVWTVVPVLLPTHVPPQLAWSALGIVSPPSKERVVQHLINLCSDTGGGGGGGNGPVNAGGGGGCVLDRWVFAEPPVAVFQSLFQYLQEQWVGLPPATQALLRDLPCVPVGNSLVRPTRLFFRLAHAQDLAPFLFEVPRAFGAYDRLLRDRMGVRAAPAVQDYARLLAELKQECGESPLNPNELEAVVKVVCLLADTAAAERDDGGAGAPRPQDLLRGWQLYAPDDRAVLVPLETCLYDDASWLRGRVHAHLLRAVHPRIGLEACRAFGIPRISQVVRECLAPDFAPEPVSALERRPAHGDPALLAATLTSTEFAHALACLFAQRDATWAHMSRQLELLGAGAGSSSVVVEGPGAEDAALRVEEMAAAVHRALQGFRVDFVRTLRSRFLRRVGGGRDEDITSQPEGSMFHVDAEARAILLAVTLLPPSVTPAYVLAMAVAQVFALGGGAGGGEWIVAPMSALLATHPPASLRQVMALLRLDARDEARAQHLRRGVPGQALQEVDKARVEFRPLRVHMQGEIVAWQERPEAPLRYGTVVSSGAGAEGEDGPKGGAGAAATGAAADVVRRLLVRVGPRKVQEMLSTQVYSFKNTKASDAGGGTGSSSASSSSSLAALRSPLLQPKVEPPALSGPATAASTAEGDVATTGAAAAGAAAAPLAPVESAQLLSAVDDILSRVNLSLGEEPKAVMERNMRLQRDLEAACREAEGAREQALEMAAQLDKIKGAFHCQVCFQRDVDQILAPCGHLLCGACRESVQTTCPFCRDRIRFVFPFFKPFDA